MAVRWELVLVAGAALFASVLLGALLLPDRGAAVKALRPLAMVERLTQLPEYIREVRVQRALLATTGLCVLAAMGGSVYASARPLAAETASAPGSGHTDDVMLCVTTSADHPMAAALFSYYQAQAAQYTDQRIGLTSHTLRAIPLTADHAFASEKLRGFAGLAALSAEAEAGRQLTDQEVKTYADLQNSFSRIVRYIDYEPNFIDTLASCVLGFPDPALPSGRRRSVVYLGPTNEDTPSGARPAYSSGALAQLAQRAKAQINIIDVEPGAGAGTQPDGVAKTETELSGGRFFAFSDTADPAALAGALDQIQANRPALSPGAEAVPVRLETDDPGLALGLAVGFATLLALCLAVVRR